MQEILQKIVEKRRQTISYKGLTFGVNIPEFRRVPLVIPDFNKGVVICEIKRGSPSEGRMNNITNPVSWADDYISGGAEIISVLTEENFFYGSLLDLINIKERYPNISLLRKDFLLSVDEIEISYRAGADLVLLITGVLVDSSGDVTLLKSMKDKAEELGMLPLIEVHDQDELEQILPLKPKLIGINSRDLSTFKIKRGYPMALKKLINYTAYIIYESGIRNKTDSFFIGLSGFNGMLVGTSIVKSGIIIDKVKELKEGYINGLKNQKDFYLKVFKKIYIDKKIVIKICGITNLDDANLAIDYGADIIGFILAKSPRQIDLDNVKKISKKIGNKVLKVGVVMDEFIEETAQAVKEGYLDAVQFQGDIDNESAYTYNVCWYKVIRPISTEDFHSSYYSPIILYDTFSKESAGGTGKTMDKKLLDYAVKNNIDLYLAGGINPDNVKSIINNYHPMMLDVCSGIEEKPGKKDPAKLKKLFEEISKINKQVWD